MPTPTPYRSLFSLVGDDGSGCGVRGSTVCFADDNAPAAGTPQAQPAPALAAAASTPTVDVSALQAQLAASEAARKATDAKLAELLPVVEKFAKVSEVFGGKEKDPAQELATLQQQTATARGEANRARVENVLFRIAVKSDAADPDDVVMALASKIAVDANGVIDEANAKAQIAELLVSKPHWKRAPISAAHAVQASGAPLNHAAAGAAPTAPAPTTTSPNVQPSEADLYRMPLGDAQKFRAEWNAKHHAH